MALQNWHEFPNFHRTSFIARPGAAIEVDSRMINNLQSDMSPEVTEAVESVYRSDWGRIVAALIAITGDFNLAEESAQEAFVAAVGQWRTSGIPEFPRAWIIQTARHK